MQLIEDMSNKRFTTHEVGYTLWLLCQFQKHRPPKDLVEQVAHVRENATDCILSSSTMNNSRKASPRRSLEAIFRHLSYCLST